MAVPVWQEEAGDAWPRSARGDSFAGLYASYAPRVRGLARRLLTDRFATEDVVQEAMLRAYREGIHFDDERDPWPWLATVTRNLCRDSARRTIRRPERVLDEATPTALSPATDGVVENRARAQFVAAALEALPDHQRNLLLLHHVEEVPCAQIAGEGDTTVDAVKSALVRARDAFRSHYEGWRSAIPHIAASLATRLSAGLRALRTAGVNAGSALPSIARPGAAAALAALIAIGLAAPPGIASDPPSMRDGTPRSADQIGGAHMASPPKPVGGRLISFQPPESPDASPTPALSLPDTPAAIPTAVLPPRSGDGGSPAEGGGGGGVRPEFPPIPDIPRLDDLLSPSNDVTDPGTATDAVNEVAGTITHVIDAVAGAVPLVPVALPTSGVLPF